MTAKPNSTRKVWRIAVILVLLALGLWLVLVLTGGGSLFDYDTF